MSEVYRPRFLGFGSYLPKNTLTNDDLSKFLDTDDQWIKKRTGISLRHIADDSESNVDMAYFAALNALKNSALEPSDIDLIIFATTTPDFVFPGCGVLLQSRLGCGNAVAFDVQAVCSGFLFASAIANDFILSGRFHRVLVVGSDVMSSIVDWTDRSTAVLFGDGSGAAIISDLHEGSGGIIDYSIKSDGKLSAVLSAEKGVRFGEVGKVRMNGRVIFEHAIEKMFESSIELINKNGFSVSEIDWFLPHQANYRIIDALASRMGIDSSKVITKVAEHANTSAASIPLAFDRFLEESGNAISKGDLVLMTAVGGGLTWGSMLFRY